MIPMSVLGWEGLLTKKICRVDIVQEMDPIWNLSDPSKNFKVTDPVRDVANLVLKTPILPPKYPKVICRFRRLLSRRSSRKWRGRPKSTERNTHRHNKTRNKKLPFTKISIMSRPECLVVFLSRRGTSLLCETSLFLRSQSRTGGLGRVGLRPKVVTRLFHYEVKTF